MKKIVILKDLFIHFSFDRVVKYRQCFVQTYSHIEQICKLEKKFYKNARARKKFKEVSENIWSSKKMLKKSKKFLELKEILKNILK